VGLKNLVTHVCELLLGGLEVDEVCTWRDREEKDLIQVFTKKWPLSMVKRIESLGPPPPSSSLSARRSKS